MGRCAAVIVSYNSFGLTEIEGWLPNAARMDVMLGCSAMSRSFVVQSRRKGN